MSEKMTWQPIETAPEDGSVFLIACLDEDAKSYEVGWYEPYEWREYVPVEGEPDLFRVVSRHLTDWAGFSNMHRATHWMPLPEPPRALSEGDA